MFAFGSHAFCSTSYSAHSTPDPSIARLPRSCELRPADAALR